MMTPEEVGHVFTAASRVRENVERVIVGKDQAVTLILIAILCEGHVLIEDVPGIGKTTLAKAIARSLGCTVRRIQSTPDLLPSDVTGTHVFNQKTSEFEFRPGPIMAHYSAIRSLLARRPSAPGAPSDRCSPPSRSSARSSARRTCAPTSAVTPSARCPHSISAIPFSAMGSAWPPRAVLPQRSASV